MRKLGVFLAALSLLLLAAPVATQEEDGNLGRIYFVTVKPGSEGQFEDGLKKHMQWHRAQKDPWSWYVWETIAGENTGMYGAGTFDHRWADFDNPPVSQEADEAEAQMSIAPHIASLMVQYYARLPKVSRPRPGGPAPMEEVLVFRLKMGAEQEFMNTIGKVHEAIGKTNWPVHYEWYALVAGGQHPTFVLVLPHDNWAAFKGPAKPFPAMLEEAVGRTEAEAILKSFDKATANLSSEVIRNRPDLSYVPSM